MIMRRIAFALATVTCFALNATAASAARSYETKEYQREFPTGLLHTSESQMFSESVSRHATTVAHVVPAKYSLRGIAGPVENQGSCGSCWDFSLTSALRGTYITAGKDPGRLSFNYLLNCDRQMYGCNGGVVQNSAPQSFA